MPQWYYTVCFFERCIALLSCHLLQEEHLGFLFFWFVVVVVFDCMQLSTSSKAVLFYLHKGEFGYVMNDKLLRENVFPHWMAKNTFFYTKSLQTIQLMVGLDYLTGLFQT